MVLTPRLVVVTPRGVKQGVYFGAQLGAGASVGRIWGSDWGSNRGSKWRSGAGVGGPGRTPFTVVKHKDLLRNPLRNPLRIPLRSTTRSLLFAPPPGVPCGLQPCKIWPLVGPQPFRVGGQGAWHKVGRAGGGIFDLYLNVDVHV